MNDMAAARLWCEALARMLTVQHITRDGTPYLERYFAAGWSPTNRRSGPAIFLHHFVASDAGEAVHSHPWGWSASLILVGGYREARCGADGHVVVREYRPGDVNVLEADDFHRIDLFEADAWSVFFSRDALRKRGRSRLVVRSKTSRSRRRMSRAKLRRTAERLQRIALRGIA